MCQQLEQTWALSEFRTANTVIGEDELVINSPAFGLGIGPRLVNLASDGFVFAALIIIVVALSSINSDSHSLPSLSLVTRFGRYRLSHATYFLFTFAVTQRPFKICSAWTARVSMIDQYMIKSS
jgi:hypothetical protein